MPVSNPTFIENPLSPVEFAFNDGVEDYYQHVDPFAAPCMRALSAITAYEELRKRTTRELDLLECDKLLLEVANIKSAIKGESAKINLVKVFEAAQQIEYVANSKKTRLELIFVPDLAYKFAAVVFFDKNESPLRYDTAYGKRKIERWKKNESISSFFFRQPIRRLIPYLEELEPNLEQYSAVVTKILNHQLQNLSTSKSSEHSTTEQGVT